ncbi:MAG: restriction endonuclease subunit R, partial [Nitrososphaera sp.]
LEELKKSNIPVRIFSEANWEKDAIQIIEIHKLVEEKKGEGVSVEASSFEGNNLIFVDEGHKGFSGKAWKSLRDKISEIGFTFEYSATFDEAISSKKDELMDEYAKAIIIDYSYAYFYYDGFGKEFTVLNLKDSEYETHKELILLTNLLSFYQQTKYYQKNRQHLGDFYFDRPLWVFVGNSVSSQKGDKFDEDTLSDLQFVVAFFNKFLADKKESVKKIDGIISDRHPLKGRDRDISFAELLPYVKKEGLSATELYDDILETVFNSESSGKLELFPISNASGEIGLKVSTAARYFALVYIGDVASFRKKLEEKHELTFREDKFTGSLFDTINAEDSPVNILMGSRRFIEGWNSFRVSTMGLLNMGKSKGSQIIQLFGRGVRLRGYNNLMKRSKMLVEERILDKDKTPAGLGYLETLNIFGIKADYVDTFRKQLEDEGITEEEIINLEIRKNLSFLKKKLITLKQKGEVEYIDALTLAYDPAIPRVTIDLRPKFEIYASTDEKMSKAQIEEKTIALDKYIDYFDWDWIYFELYNFKQQ